MGFRKEPQPGPAPWLPHLGLSTHPTVGFRSQAKPILCYDANEFPLGLSLFSTFFFFPKHVLLRCWFFRLINAKRGKQDKWGHLLAGEHITKVNRKESGFWYHVENGNPGSSDQEVGKSVPSMRNAAVEGPCESRLSISRGRRAELTRQCWPASNNVYYAWFYLLSGICQVTSPLQALSITVRCEIYFKTPNLHCGCDD